MKSMNPFEEWAAAWPLLLEIRRNRKLLKAYRGAQPADKDLRADIDVAIRALIGGDKASIERCVARMKGNLPPYRPHIQPKKKHQ